MSFEFKDLSLLFLISDRISTLQGTDTSFMVVDFRSKTWPCVAGVLALHCRCGGTALQVWWPCIAGVLALHCRCCGPALQVWWPCIALREGQNEACSAASDRVLCGLIYCRLCLVEKQCKNTVRMICYSGYVSQSNQWPDVVLQRKQCRVARTGKQITFIKLIERRPLQPLAVVTLRTSKSPITSINIQIKLRAALASHRCTPASIVHIVNGLMPLEEQAWLLLWNGVTNMS